MLTKKFYRDRYWKMVAANQKWSILPLSADDAVRRVTFQDPCPPDASKVWAFKRRDTRRHLERKGVAEQVTGRKGERWRAEERKGEETRGEEYTGEERKGK